MIRTGRFQVWCVVIIVLGAIVLSCPAAFSASKDTGEISLEGIAPDQVDSVLAKLSDEQVRSLLIQELQKEASQGFYLDYQTNFFILQYLQKIFLIKSWYILLIIIKQF